jgi:hypothetical protein
MRLWRQRSQGLSPRLSEPMQQSGNRSRHGFQGSLLQERIRLLVPGLPMRADLRRYMPMWSGLLFHLAHADMHGNREHVLHAADGYCYCEDGCDQRYGNVAVSTCDVASAPFHCDSGQEEADNCE